MTWVRCASDDCDHVSNAAEAASTAASTSAAPPSTTRACSWPVAGLNTGAVLGFAPVTGDPLIQCWMVVT